MFFSSWLKSQKRKVWMSLKFGTNIRKHIVNKQTEKNEPKVNLNTDKPIYYPKKNIEKNITQIKVKVFFPVLKISFDLI